MPKTAKAATATRAAKTCACGRVRHPVFGLPGTTAPQWCKLCKVPDAVDVKNKTCVGCTRYPSYGMHAKERKWCRACAPPEAVNAVCKRWCEECGATRATLGLTGRPGQPPRWCTSCAPAGVARNVVSKQCVVCNQHQPCYGRGGHKPQWCKSCAPPGTENVVSKRCAVVGCDIISLKAKFCANHDTQQKRKARVREFQVAAYLRDMFGGGADPWSSWNKQLVETACGKYRPDFTFELPTHVVVLEVDEYQHAKPGYSCDNARMMDVFAAYGGLPVVFLRFNPDAFKLAGAAVRRHQRTRLKVMGQELRAAMAAPPRHLLTITRLFYDNPVDTRVVVSTHVSPDDPTFTEM